MREVAWVVFDEIHYMRDKGILFEVAICTRLLSKLYSQINGPLSIDNNNSLPWK